MIIKRGETVIIASKRQSVIALGAGLIVVGIILLIFAFSSPRVSVNSFAESYSFENISSLSANSSISTKYSASVKQSSSAESRAQATNTSFPVNLNTCTAQELTAIDGIGDTRASAIIQYREYLGGYTSVEQIKEIKGIGDALYEKISPYLTV